MLHLLHQNSIELVDVLFDLAVRLLDFLENAHVLLDNVHDVVYVLSVVRYQRLFFLKREFAPINLRQVLSLHVFSALVSFLRGHL